MWSLLAAVAGIELLLPHLVGVVVDAVEATATRLRIRVRPRAVEARCSNCSAPARRVHSRYDRILSDLAVGGRQVEIQLHARRWFCPNDDCPSKTFAEQVDGLSAKHTRRTAPLRQSLERIGLALAGRAGARLAQGLGVTVGRSSILRLLRDLPDPVPTAIEAVGIDDFATRRGHRYGTVLVDMDTHRPVDLLPDRESATVARWLSEHTEVKVVCRDRAGAYAEAARTAAPQAIQVADRWHLWHNLAEHTEKAASRHADCVTAEPSTPTPTPAPTSEAPREPEPSDATLRRSRAGKLATRVRRDYQRIHALVAEGTGINEIARQLGLSRATVRRFTRAATVDHLLPTGPRLGRPSIVAPFAAHLQQRWGDGITNAATLLEEIRGLGYRGGYSALRDYLRPLRTGRPLRTATPRPPKSREIANLILRRPDTLDDAESFTLQHIRRCCPDLDRLASHVANFAKMLTGLHGHDLDAWMTAVKADNHPELHSFVRGIEADYDAVRNGLTLAHNSGAVEGHVNRIKMIKRQMYGRANFDLLRLRVLLS